MTRTTPRRSMTAARRLRIFQAHDGLCVLCGAKIDGTREAWTVEHVRALGLAGEDEDSNCGPAHEKCRRIKDKNDVSRIAKAKRQQYRHAGARAPSNRPMPFGKADRFKRKLNGQIVEREKA